MVGSPQVAALLGMVVEVHAEITRFGEKMDNEEVYVLEYNSNDIYDFYTRMCEMWH
jgi:hypothetical protein